MTYDDLMKQIAVAVPLMNVNAIRAARQLSDKNRIVVTGVGKSGIAAEKFAATLRAYGIASNFMHPVDALHGDIGAMSDEDGLVVFSASANTKELHSLLEHTSRPDVGVFGVRGSLCDAVHYPLCTGFGPESDTVSSFVPTVSFIAQVIASDMIAIELAALRGAPGPKATHPGGNLGSTSPWRTK